MIRKTLNLVERHPGQAALMGAGLIAGVLVARHLADDERRASLLSQLDSAVGKSQQASQGLSLPAVSPQKWLPSPSLPQKLGIREKTVAVFLATFLAKSITGFYRWRSQQRALRTGVQSRSVPPVDQESLSDMTVAELRVAASEMDVEGRSSMNKSELVDALNKQDPA